MYKDSLVPTYSPLLTDFYQLTMAYGYFQHNMHEREAVFHLLFRTHPFNGQYALNAGLGNVVDYLNQWQFAADDIAYLATLKNKHNLPLFPADFLDYLRDLHFTCDVDAIPEGNIVFANAPLLRIQGPLLQCQLLETPLLNLINFQTLIATKASRICKAAAGEPVIEFGMRRAQGADGALSASRAAYIGGCVATSNTLAGKCYDIPVRGTHAHSWVTAFDSELAAFTAYADVLPDHCVLLVDTYNTLKGVEHAITVGKKLREHGADLLAIRLDSGDLADLSIKARRMLDAAEFQHTGILASNLLDEYVIADLKKQHAAISSWGVGTHLATAYDQPALDGVYKLSALRDAKGEWQYKLKLSEQAIKISNPGRHQVRRFFRDEQYIADVIYDLSLGISDVPTAVTIADTTKAWHFDDYDACVDLLQPLFKQGVMVQPQPSLADIRNCALAETAFYFATSNEKPYPVLLEKKLADLKNELISQVK